MGVVALVGREEGCGDGVRGGDGERGRGVEVFDCGLGRLLALVSPSMLRRVGGRI